MPDDARDDQPLALFLLAHQDDEFGVFDAILECHRRGWRARCAFLTEGPRGSRLAARREAESRRVLRDLDVAADDIVFAGSLLGIADGTLAERLAVAAPWLRNWMRQAGRIELICVPAWEGGHPDHDALHAITVLLASELGLLGRLRQFALYHALGRRWPFLNVLAPLPANGPVVARKIDWRRRCRFVRLCLCYHSQRKTWSGLLPGVIAHYLRHGTQTLQAVSLERLRQRPHEGALQYERKRFYTWEQMRARLRPWRAAVRDAR